MRLYASSRHSSWLSNICNPKAHLTLKLVGLLLGCLTDGMTAAELTALPAGFAALICHYARFADGLWGNELIVHEDD